MELSVTQLRKILLYCPQARAEEFIEPLNLAMHEFGIEEPLCAAAFLAQLAHESGEFRYMEELADGSVYDGRENLGNTRPEAVAIAKQHGSTPGPFWKGHGPIQITGYDNHAWMAGALGIDCVNEPKLLTEPLNGCRAAAVFWRNAPAGGRRVDLNKYCDDVEVCSAVVNRGTLNTEIPANHLKERRAYYERGVEVLT